MFTSRDVRDFKRKAIVEKKMDSERNSCSNCSVPMYFFRAILIPEALADSREIRESTSPKYCLHLITYRFKVTRTFVFSCAKYPFR